MEMVKIGLGILSTLCLVALSAYIYLANKGGSALIYTFGNKAVYRNLTFYQRCIRKSFFILGALGFLVCMFYGAEKMLFWMPYDWEAPRVDGEFYPLKGFLAGLFTLFGGGVLIGFIEKATINSYSLQLKSIECDELRKLLSYTSTKRDYDGLIEGYESKRAELKMEIERKYDYSISATHATPEGQMDLLYCELAGLARSLKQRQDTSHP